MCQKNTEMNNIQELSASEDPLQSMLNAYLNRAIRVEKELTALNQEIAMLILDSNKNTARRALLTRIK